MTSNDTEPRRRSLIRGVAWAAPTMAAAVAAPAIAVSTPCAETDVTLNWGMSAYSGLRPQRLLSQRTFGSIRPLPPRTTRT